ncbi:unnamed protein product [Peronospora belbahrii]|uniref:Uncharacterized protein n=1 Tax=Peronospora belbahrii TaxID=622444 RepID=A0ABN8CUM6_9STRA|nr:unnamed protein product [Peronospora belbahrii]
MVARQLTHLLRSSAAQRQTYTSLVNKKNHVPDDQKLFLTSKAPTYIKRSSDRPLLTVMFLCLGLGFAQSLRGEIYMGTGTGKKD